jgi:hypothetical protein
MLHPFLILPLVGSFTLGKIAADAINRKALLLSIVLIGLISVVCFCIWAYLNGDIKPYRPKRDNPFMMVHQWLPPLRLLRRHQPDHARVVFDLFAMDDIRNVVRNDANTDVHNHHIQESLRESIRQLDEWYKTVPESQRLTKSDTFKSVKEFLFGGYKDKLDRKEKAYGTIRYIARTDGKLQAVNLTEGEILQRVWQRINDPINNEVCDDLRNNLLDLLADSAIEIDVSYCLVGRITRMVQSLQCIDKAGLVDIKSIGIIAKEIQNKIPVLRDEFFADHPALLTMYDEGNDMVATQLIDFVREGLYKDYPQAGTDDAIQRVISEHLEALD